MVWDDRKADIPSRVEGVRGTPILPIPHSFNAQSKYLQPGQIDDKIDQYIETVLQNVKLRSHLVQLVRNYLQNTGMEATGVDALHDAYFGSNPPQPLKTAEMHEILIRHLQNRSTVW